MCKNEKQKMKFYQIPGKGKANFPKFFWQIFYVFSFYQTLFSEKYLLHLLSCSLGFHTYNFYTPFYFHFPNVPVFNSEKFAHFLHNFLHSILHLHEAKKRNSEQFNFFFSFVFYLLLLVSFTKTLIFRTDFLNNPRYLWEISKTWNAVIIFESFIHFRHWLIYNSNIWNIIKFLAISIFTMTLSNSLLYKWVH